VEIYVRTVLPNRTHDVGDNDARVASTTDDAQTESFARLFNELNRQHIVKVLVIPRHVTSQHEQVERVV